MNKTKRNLILGIIIIAASVTGYFLREKEMQSYVVETVTDSDGVYSSAVPSAENDENLTDADGEKVNINTASASQLEKLDGIGQKKAERIVQHREKYGNFEVIEDIMKVDGIGRKTFELFKNDITVE